jgi:hypothetical protein
MAKTMKQSTMRTCYQAIAVPCMTLPIVTPHRWVVMSIIVTCVKLLTINIIRARIDIVHSVRGVFNKRASIRQLLNRKWVSYFFNSLSSSKFLVLM